MQDNGDTPRDQVEVTQSALFIVRQGEGQNATYAICNRVDSQGGGYRLAGAGKTLAELVDEQNLSAALVPPGTPGSTMSFRFEPQSGRNVFIQN